MTWTCQRKIILASSSPRRREILASAGVDFELCPSQFIETQSIEDPIERIRHNAEGKARDIAKARSDELVLGVDTVGLLNGEILEKPKDRTDAKRMLKMLSGQTHEVWSGVCLIENEKTMQWEVCTKVSFHDISDEDIEAYLNTGEYSDKAAAYAIQGKGAVFVKSIEGDYLNVVGLPLQSLWFHLKMEAIH